jgi:glycosyltransferase involved in cell wall biosynthesis
MQNNIPVSIISNIFNPVGPTAPGGLEVFNYYLTKELEERNINIDIDIELYASGDSEKLKSLKPIINLSLGYSQTQEFLSVPWNYRRLTVREFLIYTDFIRKQTGSRLIHFSLVNFLPIYLAAKQNLPMLVTLHMPVENLHYQALQQLLNKEELRRVHFVGISQAQVKNFPDVFRIIYNGVNLESFPYSRNFRDTFIWIGRFVKEKGCSDAIKSAEKAKVILEIAGAPHDKNENDYFIEKIEPKISTKIIYKDFVKDKQRSDFYAAKAMLFTPKWDEPFGLTMIEAMACGTPVIAYNRGAVSEIIKDGETGYLVPADSAEGLAQAITRIQSLSQEQYLEMRKNCREHIEKNFSFTKMVDEYLLTYQEIWNKRA